MSCSSDEVLRTEVAQSGLGLTVLWVGRLVEDGPIVGIVEDPQTGRRYTWPGLKSWRNPLPDDRKTQQDVAEQTPTLQDAMQKLPMRRTKQIDLFDKKQLSLF